MKCKVCNKEYTAENKRPNRLYCNDCNLNNSSTKTILYYLPEEHYIGITNNIPRRMKAHKESGNIKEGWEVIAIFERRVDASLLEVMFHQRGYNGYQDNRNH